MGENVDTSADRRRLLPLLGVAVLALAVLGAIDIATSTEPGPEEVRVPPALTGPELIACSHTIVVGVVRSAEDPPRNESTVDVTIDVLGWLKAGSPRRGPADFTTLAPSYAGEPRLRPGERVLVIEWSYPYENASRVFRAEGRRGVSTLADVRAQIKGDLAQARHTRCPAFWRDPESYRTDVPADAA